MVQKNNRLLKDWKIIWEKSFLGKEDIQNYPCILGKLESHTYSQGRIIQKRPKKILSFHLWLISGLSINRK